MAEGAFYEFDDPDESPLIYLSKCLHILNSRARKLAMHVYGKLRCRNFGGIDKCLDEAADLLGISKSTLKRIKLILDKDDDIPKIGITSFHLHQLLVKKLDFVFKRRERNVMLMESDDIISWKARYLRKIKKFRSEGRNIIFLDETWINAGHTTNKIGKDTSLKSAKNAWRCGLTTGLKDPTGRGNRLIIVHAGSRKGFVTGALLFLLVKKLEITIKIWMAMFLKNGPKKLCFLHWKGIQLL
uniref:Tc1-like transposase DDE domain-containing protein n=1 Tax=Strigamia maritima TaxID=126957 RepID=T1JAH8_STRMM